MRRIFIAIYVLLSSSVIAQSILTVDSVIAISLRNHPQLLVAQQELEEQMALKRGSFSLPDPQILFEAPTGEFFTTGIQQSIDNPLVYIQQSRVGRQRVALAKAGIVSNKSEVVRQVKIAYIQMQYAETRVRQSFIQDSIFNALNIASDKRHVAGDAGLLEKTSAQARAQESAQLFRHVLVELSEAKQTLALLTGLDTSAISVAELARYPDAENVNLFPSTSPIIDYSVQSIVVASQQLKLTKAAIAPGFSFGYMNQADKSSPLAQRFQFGLSVPLWFWTHSSRIKAAKANVEKAEFTSALVTQRFNIAWLDAITAYQKHLSSLEYYENTGLQQSETILDAGNRSYSAGEIGYVEYLVALNLAFDIKSRYYSALKDYNASIIELSYLKGN